LHNTLTLRSARLASQAERLQALDPRAVLRRGFVWVEDGQARPVVSVAGLHPQDVVKAVWADGTARARIESVQADIALDPDATEPRP
jgi:exodeoxyribonuclease VII large subunit